jgi:predicted permease
MSGFIQDLRHAIRLFASHPGWTAVALLSLALGIGVNATAFSVADALFLRPLPVASPDEIVELGVHAEGGREESFSFPEYLELRENLSALQGLAAYMRRGTMLKQNGEAELLPVNIVSANYFEVLGVSPMLGRALNPSLDASLNAPPAIVISNSLWRRRFGGDPAIVGRAIHLNDSFVTVAGVMPASFPGLERGYITDIWASPSAWLAMGSARSDFEDRLWRDYHCIGRLHEGASGQSVQTQAAAVGKRLASAWPASNRDISFYATLASANRQEQLRPALLLLAIVGLVLWIACGNVAGLLLSLSEGRRREIGIRQALGASRSRLIRQMISESAILAAAGAMLGLLFAWWLMELAPSLLPPSPFEVDYGLGLDWRVVTFALGLTVISVLLFGLTPALRASRVDIVPELKGSSAGAQSGRRHPFRSGVVVAQIALAVALLNTAGLLFRSYAHTRGESMGFDPSRNLISILLNPSPQERARSMTPIYERLREELTGMPGVRRVTFARRLPMSGSGGGATVKVQFRGLNLPEDRSRAALKFNQVGPDYFQTLGTNLLRGRGFNASDAAGQEPVILVSETLASRYFKDRDPLDQSLLIEGKPARIVGVVEDARINEIHEKAEPFIYFPYAQFPDTEGTLIVETHRDPSTLIRPVKDKIRQVAPSSEILTTVTMREHMWRVLYDDWAQALLSSGVALIGVLLAAVGLFAAVSYAVGRRTREFGIRLAIGAQRRDVFRLVLRQGIVLAALGTACGLAAALAVSRMLSGLLYGVQPHDALTLTVSAVIALAVALLASLQPARRAVRLDPLNALRCE